VEKILTAQKNYKQSLEKTIVFKSGSKDTIGGTGKGFTDNEPSFSGISCEEEKVRPASISSCNLWDTATLDSKPKQQGSQCFEDFTTKYVKGTCSDIAKIALRSRKEVLNASFIARKNSDTKSLLFPNDSDNASGIHPGDLGDENKKPTKKFSSFRLGPPSPINQRKISF